MFGGDFGLPPGPRYERRSTGGAPPVVYLGHAVTPSRLPFLMKRPAVSHMRPRNEVVGLDSRSVLPSGPWGLVVGFRRRGLVR
eukprot:scaffold68316_cov59-Phaeocystis_antarctica.AAC.7